MDGEIQLLREHITDRSELCEASVQITRGHLEGHEVFLCISGVGKVNAAATAQYLISTRSVDAILNIGLAGNCAQLPLGGAVLPKRIVYHDYNMAWISETLPGVEFFSPDPELFELAARAVEELGVTHMEGVLASGDQFVSDREVKRDIVERTGASCIDMEGAAIAHTAMRCGIPFVSLKVMSDNADDGALEIFHDTLEISEYCERSANIIRGIVKRMK